jgi:hypothetical protein
MNNKQIKSYLSHVSTGILLVLLLSCSRNVKVENMMPSELNVVNRHPYTVSLTVKGQMGLSSARGRKDDIDHERLTHVIHKSISESGLFKAIVSEQEADFLLDVIVFRSNVVGTATAKVTTVVPMNWVLMRREPRGSVYEKRTAHQVSVRARDNLGGANRFSTANEGSVQKSIEEAIFNISQLDLSN